MSTLLSDYVLQCIAKEGGIMAKTDTQISFRTTQEFKDRLERQATKERRFLSNMIINVMTDYLERVEEADGSTEQA